MELPLNTVGRGNDPGNSAELGSARDALDARSTHQKLHRLVPDRDALPQPQFGMNSSNAIGASRGEVCLTDQVDKPCVPDGSHRGRP